MKRLINDKAIMNIEVNVSVYNNDAMIKEDIIIDALTNEDIINLLNKNDVYVSVENDIFIDGEKQYKVVWSETTFEYMDRDSEYSTITFCLVVDVEEDE